MLRGRNANDFMGTGLDICVLPSTNLPCVVAGANRADLDVYGNTAYEGEISGWCWSGTAWEE